MKCSSSVNLVVEYIGSYWLEILYHDEYCWWIILRKLYKGL